MFPENYQDCINWFLKCLRFKFNINKQKKEKKQMETMFSRLCKHKLKKDIQKAKILLKPTIQLEDD